MNSYWTIKSIFTISHSQDCGGGTRSLRVPSWLHVTLNRARQLFLQTTRHSGEWFVKLQDISPSFPRITIFEAVTSLTPWLHSWRARTWWRAHYACHHWPWCRWYMLHWFWPWCWSKDHVALAILTDHDVGGTCCIGHDVGATRQPSVRPTV